jgi:pimeloyl-ACP methyl ester carboxylesterase
LAGSFRVISYDRRGHGSTALSGETISLSEQVSDLSELISLVARGPVHVVATGAGATVALKLTLSRPDQVRSLNLHEPSLTGLLDGDAMAAPLYQAFHELDTAVTGRLRARDGPGAAQLYSNGADAEAGGWARLPPELQRSFVQNASATLREFEDPTFKNMEIDGFAMCRKPIVITGGAHSAPGFASINDHVAGGFYQALRYSFDAAGHFPHATQAERFAYVTAEFCRFAAQQAPD